MLDALAKKPLWFKLQILATLILLVPIWYFQYLPLNDWPNHLASMHLLAEFDAGTPTYIQPNPAMLLPNATVFYFMRYAGPFIGIETAGRLLLSIYLILMPFSMGYFLRQFHPSLEPLGLAGAALAYNWFFSMGFLNFTLSLPLFLLSAGYWMAHRHRLREKKPFLLAAALFTIAFLTHLVAGAVLALFIFFIRLRDEISHRVQKKKSKGFVSRLRSLIFALLPDVAAFLPSVAIGLISLPSILGAESFSAIIWSSAGSKLQYLLVLLPATYYTLAILTVLGLVIAFSAGLRRLMAGPDRFLSALALLLLLLAVLLPESTSSWQFAAPRLLPFFLFIALAALLLPLTLPKPLPIFSLEVPVALFILVMVQTAWLSFAWSSLQAPLNSMAHLADHLPARASVWPMGYGTSVSDPELRVSPYFQAWGYWVVQKDVFVPELFSGAYSPILYAPEAASSREAVDSWLHQLVVLQFTNRTLGCGAWNAYYSLINWSVVATHYDYVAMRYGACDNLSAVPAGFTRVYADPPLYLYKTNRTIP